MAAGEDEKFAGELRRAIEQSGLTLTAISQRLRTRQRPVSVATLSNWQSGRSLPGGEQSLGVVAAIEELLGRPPESLAELVGAPGCGGGRCARRASSVIAPRKRCSVRRSRRSASPLR
ncbi:helix-turn-helix domain-containing protein [Brachybacterium avium]|uniref:helix-turn-helix domain-containing protein n=1 Tax=Brachybacterium avium TaxID=2017485 RepID=UPI001FE2F77D|nr:helix-turn-helix transcriptional regulator [Brachybacterium avium]